MGLDREAGALLVAQSDAPGAARGRGDRRGTAACEAQRREEVFVTDDPDEGELFVQARRLPFPAPSSAAARCCSRTSARRSRCCPTCSPRSRPSPTARRRDPGRRPRRRRQHPPVSSTTPGDPDAERRARLAFDEMMAAAIALGGTITGEHGVGRPRRALPAPARPGRDGADPPGQGRPRPGTASSTPAPGSDSRVMDKRTRGRHPVRTASVGRRRGEERPCGPGSSGSSSSWGSSCS